MTLLKGDNSLPEKIYKIKIDASEGIGQSIKDGWYFGIGFGLAMTIAVPFILLLGSLLIIIALTILGAY